MYTPSHFEETRIEVMHQLMRSHRLATLVHQSPSGLEANHIPLLIDPTRGAGGTHGKYGTLVGHVARANPIWQQAANQEMLVIFQGPQAYISPSWYISKQLHGKVVPTWNYAVVHAHGTLRTIDDAEWLLAHVATMTDTNERARPERWRVSDAPADFIDTMLKGIVGIEIKITRLTGKWKVSQNRSVEDRVGVVMALTSENQDAMAALIRQDGV